MDSDFSPGGLSASTSYSDWILINPISRLGFEFEIIDFILFRVCLFVVEFL